MMILIVDDALDSRVLATSLVRKMFPQGQIIPAASVHEALELLKTRTPDLLISDLYIKDGSGFDLLRALPGPSRGFPILVMSFENRPDVVQRLTDAGADDFVSKPIDAPLFWQKLGRLLLVPSSEPRPAGASPAPAAARPESEAPPIQLELTASLLELSEHQVVFAAPMQLSPGARIDLSLGKLVLPGQVVDSMSTGPGGPYRTSVLIGEELPLETAAEIRRMILAD